MPNRSVRIQGRSLWFALIDPWMASAVSHAANRRLILSTLSMPTACRRGIPTARVRSQNIKSNGFRKAQLQRDAVHDVVWSLTRLFSAADWCSSIVISSPKLLWPSGPEDSVKSVSQELAEKRILLRGLVWDSSSAERQSQLRVSHRTTRDCMGKASA